MAHTGQAAIVTGASRGIGRSIASRLAESGFAVIVKYAGSTVDADEVVRAIPAAGGRILCQRRAPAVRQERAGL